MWNGVLPAISGRYRAIVPDLRGHGGSEGGGAGSFTFPSLEEDLLALLDEEGVARGPVVGLSAGAFLALAFTLDHPERVSALVSIAGGSQCDNHTRAIGDRWAQTYREEGFDAYVLRLVKDLYYPEWAEEHLDIVDRVRARVAATEFASVQRWGAAIRHFDVRGRVGRIGRPTLVMHGMDDQVVDVAHARLLRQSIPGAELRLFARTGHLVPVERPTECADALLGWLEKLPGSGPAVPRA